MCKRIIKKINKRVERAEGMVQVVEHLPSKHKTSVLPK
jgi:hypothetical protein